MTRCKFFASLLMFYNVTVLSAETPSSQPTSMPAAVSRASQPRLLRRIELGTYGAKFFRFGDLDGDGIPDAIAVQATAPQGQPLCRMTCLTAITLEGKILWQVGEPTPAN